MSIIAWLASNSLGDVLEDAEAREATVLRRSLLKALRKHLVFLTATIDKTAHKGRSGLGADDISDHVGWLGDQILFLARQTFIFSCLILFFRLWWEKAITNLTWLDFCKRHLWIAFLTVIRIVDLIGEHDIKGVVKAGPLRDFSGTCSLEIVRLRVSVSGERWLAGWGVVSAVTALEQGSLWHEGNLLDFAVKQVVQVALDQAFLRMAAVGTPTLLLVLLVWSFRLLGSQST